MMKCCVCILALRCCDCEPTFESFYQLCKNVNLSLQIDYLVSEHVKLSVSTLNVLVFHRRICNI